MAVPSKWRQHIETWQSSGLSQRDYCAQQQINFRTFTARLSEYRKLPNVASVSLIPIHIESTGNDVVVLKHTQGHQLELPSSVSASWVAELLRCLA